MDEEAGYYQRRAALGAKGDFLTAPETSQVFGEIVGLWFAALWRQTGSPAPFLFAEMGAGQGTLMRDALRAIAQAAPDFLKEAKILFVEKSARLKKAQAGAVSCAEFRESFSEIPEAPLFLLANEFFDALPIRQFVRKQDALYERHIAAAEKNRLAPILLPAAEAIRFPPDAPSDEILERRFDGERLACEIAARVARHGGAALIMDYGYAEESYGDTLQAIRNHRFHGVFDDVGEADISAHVDFAALGGAARRGGARVMGPVDQGVFLKRLGAETRFDALIRQATEAEKIRLARQARRLMAPTEMGRLFKAMALTPSSVQNVAGFM